MIAPQLLTTGSKPQAPQQHLQQQQSAGGFQSLLTTTDSSLMDLAQNTGAAAAKTQSKVQQAANTNKPKSDDPTATPYVAVPTQPSQTPPAQPATSSASAPAPPSPTPPALLPDVKALDANGVANGAAIPAAATSDAAAANQSSSNNGNSTTFGADALNARIASGAPIYASQPSAAMATVPPHLLDAANSHALPSEPVGKPGDDNNGKAPANANATLPASTANAATTTAAPLLPNHPANAAAANANSNNGDNSATPAQSADNSATPTSNDPSTPNASLLAQPNQPQSAPAQIDAAAHAAAPYVPVGEQVALNLKQAIAADNNEIRIQLKPASLGTIDVKLNVGQDGRVNAVISADRSDTLNMLKQDAGTLQQALRDAGLNADSSSLSFNLSSDAQSFAQNWSHGSSGGSSGGDKAYTGTASDSLLGTDAATPAQRLHAGALDIEV